MAISISICLCHHPVSDCSCKLPLLFRTHTVSATACTLKHGISTCSVHHSKCIWRSPESSSHLCNLPDWPHILGQGGAVCHCTGPGGDLRLPHGGESAITSLATPVLMYVSCNQCHHHLLVLHQIEGIFKGFPRWYHHNAYIGLHR